MDRFALNAMIERLLESDGYDDEAREAVASFSSGMRRSSRYRFYSHISKPGDKVSGQTNLGTVEVENDKRVEKEISLGAREERIGQYKLYRHRRTLDIVHFWKSEITSASD